MTRTPRQKRDFYETPPHYLTALQRVIGVPSGRLLEPCVGRGAIVDMLKVNGIWTRADLASSKVKGTHRLDMRRRASWQSFSQPADVLPFRRRRFDWTITNPPFTSILAILRHALTYSRNVAMLARLSFLEPTIARRLFWTKWQANVEVIVLPRYGFTKPSKDTMTCCWLIWREIGRERDGYGPNNKLQISTRRQSH